MNIKINKFEYVPTDKGIDRWMVETSEGVAAIWDKKVAEVMPLWLDKFVEVETTTSKDGRFTNITKIIGSGVQKVSTPNHHPSATSAPYNNNGARVGNAVKLAVELMCVDKTLGKTIEELARELLLS